MLAVTQTQIAVGCTIGILIAAGCVFVVWCCLKIGRIDCSDEISEPGYSDWCGGQPLTQDEMKKLRGIVEGAES